MCDNRSDYIDVDTILKEISDSLTWNYDIPETINENTDANFNDMLHNNFEYLTDDVIKEFIDECFIKDIIFVENSVYDNFYDEVRENNHDAITNNNSNNACITKNVNVVESSIRHDKITIHSNSNFDNIPDAKSLPLMKRTELIALAKSPFSTTL